MIKRTPAEPKTLTLTFIGTKISTKKAIFIATKHEKTNLEVIQICSIISFIFDF